jgi:hypothetical protein
MSPKPIICGVIANAGPFSDPVACAYPPSDPTNPVEGREERVHLMSPGPNRWRERSRTLPGVAAAMAEQWGRADAIQLELGA